MSDFSPCSENSNKCFSFVPLPRRIRNIFDDSPSQLTNESLSPKYIYQCSPGSTGHPDVVWKETEIAPPIKPAIFTPKFIKKKFDCKLMKVSPLEPKPLRGFERFQKDLKELLKKNDPIQNKPLIGIQKLNEPLQIKNDNNKTNALKRNANTVVFGINPLTYTVCLHDLESVNTKNDTLISKKTLNEISQSNSNLPGSTLSSNLLSDSMLMKAKPKDLNENNSKISTSQNNIKQGILLNASDLSSSASSSSTIPVKFKKYYVKKMQTSNNIFGTNNTFKRY